MTYRYADADGKPDELNSLSRPQLRALARRQRTELRRYRDASTSTGEANVVSELTAELERARAREVATLNSLAAARGESTHRGILGELDRVAGKPALAELREMWGRWVDVVNNMPRVRRTEGFKEVLVTVASEVIPDLYLMGIAVPRGRREVREQHVIERQFRAIPFVALLCRDEPWVEPHRARLFARAARCYLRPSLWAVYEKASDASLNRDALGTVFK